MPIDLETIGYFLFMEEQEQKETRSRSDDREQEEEEQDEQSKERRLKSPLFDFHKNFSYNIYRK